MDRRTFVSILGVLGLRAAPPAAAAQPPRVPRVGFLHFGTPATTAGRIAAFQQGLRALGYVEGQNIVVEYRRVEEADRIPVLASELVGLKPDAIVTSGSRMARALRQATNTIPIVVAVTSDPVEEGLAVSLARPGGNVTGLAFQEADLSTKRLQLLKEALPGVSRVAVLLERGRLRSILKGIEAAAKALDLKLQFVEWQGSDDLARAFEEAKRGRAQALMPVGSPAFAALRERFVGLAARHRLPATCENRDFVAAGCLMGYGPNFDDMFRRTAYYVDKLLKGARAAELPIEQPTKFELFVNVRTAKALGLTIPPMLLLRADQVVE